MRPVGQGEITKQKIVDGAAQLFSKKGYTATSIEDIRKAIGISKGNIYTHFSSKEELYLYALELFIKQWLLEVETEIAHLDRAEDQLFALAKYYANDLDYGLERTVPEYIATVGADEYRSKAEEMLKREFQIFKNILQDGVANKEFIIQNTEDAALVLYTLFTNLAISKYLLNDRNELERTYCNSVTLFLNGLK